MEVIVVGDLMLDVYVRARIKDSAPVESNAIVALHQEEYLCPGGAANVANNVRSLGQDTVLCGMLGPDDSGSKLYQLLDAKEHLTFLPLIADNWPTTTKTRFVTEYGQLLRLDREQIYSYSGYVAHPLEKILNKVGDRLGAGSKNILVVSDYGKGFCEFTTVGELARRHGEVNDAPVLVDPPRDGRWVQYGSPNTMFKANLKQTLAFLKSGFDDITFKARCGDLPASVGRDYDTYGYAKLWQAAADILHHRRVAWSYLWITLGKHGSIIGASRNNPVLIKGHSIEVGDPTGAGDTALAVMAWHLAVAGKYDWPTVLAGAHTANTAGALAVSHRGTYRVTREELTAGIMLAGKLTGQMNQ
jgi:D-glycero-beta-D-manno-heptose-7-phosphate kinase